MKFEIVVKDKEDGRILVEKESDCILGAFSSVDESGSEKIGRMIFASASGCQLLECLEGLKNVSSEVLKEFVKDFVLR